MDLRAVFNARTGMVLLTVLLAASCATVPTPFEVIPHDYTGGTKVTNRGISYGAHRSQKLDVYDSAGTRGTIVYLHGGGWGGGSRAVVPSLLLHQVTRGWDLVSVDYRLAGTATFPAAVHDASAAVSWVRGQGPRYGLSANRVVLSGWSAGANIATLAAYGANNPGFPGGDLTPVDAVIPFAGAYDMKTVGLAYLDESGGWLVGLPGGRHDSSPNVWLDALDPPTLAIHGVEDWLLPVAQVRSLAARSRAVGHSVRLKVIETSSPAFEERCRTHEPWCGAPVTEVNKFLDELPRAS